MTQSEEQLQDDVPQNSGLALGIDFGNSQISAAVWRPDKRTSDMVKFGDKSSFPATLYFSGLAEKGERNLDEQNEREDHESKIENDLSDEDMKKKK